MVHPVRGEISLTVLPHHREYGSVPRRFMKHCETSEIDLTDLITHSGPRTIS